MLQNVPIESGISAFIFEYLNETAKILSEKGKVCILQFDETATQKRVEYKSVNDIVFGIRRLEWLQNK